MSARVSRLHVISHDGIRVALWVAHAEESLHYEVSIHGTGILTGTRGTSLRQVLAKTCEWLYDRDLDPADVFFRVRC